MGFSQIPRLQHLEEERIDKHRFTHAVVSRIPNSLFNKALALNDYKGYFDLSAARSQHASFILSLRLCGLDVIELAAVESSPFCCLTGESAVIIDGVALLANLSVERRNREIEAMKIVLRREGLEVLQCQDQYATLSANDVLFTGREIFVGLSNYSNLNGAKCVASAFPDYKVNLIKVPRKRHLKYHVCLAAPDTLVFGASQVSAVIKEQMYQLSEFGGYYKTFTTFHDAHVGCFYTNQKVFHVSPMDCPTCAEEFTSRLDVNTSQPTSNEFSRIYRGVQSRALLFNLYP